MRIWNGLDSLPPELGSVAGTIGKCDGVHLGHRAILRSAVGDARARNVRSLLLSFDPHPAAVLAPERRPRLIQTRRQKLDALEETGIDDLLLLPFDRALAALDGEAFFERLLWPRLRLVSLHVGEDFRFGRGRSGDLTLLGSIAARLGFRVVTVPAVRVDGVVVSSSAVRGAVERGDVELARRMLGRPFSVTGVVVQGDGRGRDLQFPTANLEIDNELLPRPGVYITESVVLAARHASVTNVGVRPTFGGRRLTVESHLLEFDGDLYSERLEVRFLARVRDEMRFETPLELADQIARDRAAAFSYFQNLQLRAP